MGMIIIISLQTWGSIFKLGILSQYGDKYDVPTHSVEVFEVRNVFLLRTDKTIVGVDANIRI